MTLGLNLWALSSTYGAVSLRGPDFKSDTSYLPLGPIRLFVINLGTVYSNHDAKWGS